MRLCSPNARHHYRSVVVKIPKLTSPLSGSPLRPPSYPFAFCLSPVQLVRALAAAGANPNIVTRDHGTPVAFACQANLPHTLAALLSVGASPHYANKGMPTPLQGAIIKSRPKCLGILLAAGANPDEQHGSVSSFITAKLEKCLGKKYQTGTSGARVLRVLRVAHAYTARSWTWPSHHVTVAFMDSENEEDEIIG